MSVISLSSLPQTPSLVLLVSAASLLAFLWLLLRASQRRPFPHNAPALTKGGNLPIIGAGLRFFNERWDFHRQASIDSKGQAFSYYVGPHPVIGMTGEENRKLFFEHRGLNFTNAYTTLFGGGAELHNDSSNKSSDGDAGAEARTEEDGFGQYFNRRLIAMLKGPQLRKGLPKLLQDTRNRLDELARSSSGITDPFDSIYRIVFQLTMRTVAANEVAEDDVIREKCLQYFEMIDATTSAWNVMFPWFYWPSSAKRTYAGGRLYMIFRKIVADRRKHNRTEDDAVQWLMDQGDNVVDIITFVLGSLFAGQLNSGINAAYLICFLGRDQYWKGRVVEEINTVVDKYSPDKTRPLKDRLMDVPLEAWEGEFPIVDICLKDSIRLNLPGTAFRQNLTGQDIPLDKTGKVIPNGAFLTYASGDMFYNPDIYPNPEEWDPARYLPERAEDKKVPHAWTGWGVGRHPCLGMRFAKLEMSMIVSFFVAYFPDFYLCDETGQKSNYIPLGDRNAMSAKKPSSTVYVKYQ